MRQCCYCGRTPESAPGPWTFLVDSARWVCGWTDCREKYQDDLDAERSGYRPISADVHQVDR